MTQAPNKTQVIYVEPRIFLKNEDRTYYNPELIIVKDEKLKLTLINCDGTPYREDHIIRGENVEIKTVNEIRNNYCVLRTIEIEPWHSDEPALAGRIVRIFGNRQETVWLQTYLYYRGKWYVFTYFK